MRSSGETGMGRAGGDSELEPNSISGCVVVHNEETLLDRCLRSLDGVVDELIVIHDGPCQDRTLEIARSHGASVVVGEFHGACEPHKVTAYEMARGEWLLKLDADEFLSNEMREAIPRLVANTWVNGYEFFWPIWDGSSYVSESGPYKLALMRRSATHLLGMIHEIELVDEPIERTDLHLEHRPRYNNFSTATVGSKWNRWAKLHARDLLGAHSDIPRFNWSGSDRWPWYRPVLNRFSPLTVFALPPLAFLRFIWIYRDHVTFRENVRISAMLAVYVGLVQYHVARGRYRR